MIPTLKPLPAGYKYRPKVFYARQLFDLLHKLHVLSNKVHFLATNAVMMNSKLYDSDVGGIGWIRRDFGVGK